MPARSSSSQQMGLFQGWSEPQLTWDTSNQLNKCVKTLTANSLSATSLLSAAFLGFPAAADAVLLFLAGPAEG